MAKIAELREMDDDELNNRLAEAKQELFNLRFQHVTGQLDNYARIGDVRRSVAQIHGLLREREIDAAEAGVPASAVRAAPVEEEEGRRRRRARVLASRRREAAEPETTEDEGDDDRG